MRAATSGPTAQVLTFSQLIAGWRDEMTARGVRPESIDKMTSIARRAADGCGWTTSAHIDYGECVAWLAAKRRSDWAGATYDHAASVLRSLGHYLRRRRLIADNPLLDILPSREPGGDGSRAYRTDEARAHVSASLRRHETDGRARGNAPLFWTFCFLTGLRHHEASTVPWASLIVDDPAAAFLLTDPAWDKSRRRERLPICRPLAGLLRAHRDQVPHGRANPVWPTRPTRATWHTDREAAGIPEVDDRGRPATPHCCRKSFSTWLDECPGITRGTVSRLTRHATTITEERYIDPSMERERSAVDMLPEIWPAGKRPTWR